MAKDQIAILETRQAEDHQDLLKKHKAVGRQLRFLNQRLGSAEDRIGELEGTVDELRYLLRRSDSDQPDPSNGQPVSRSRARDRLLSAGSDPASSTT